jgi:Alw26I/Eco31I/Esp3I family type II restriction m6 adenine DNA methyltransferase
LIENCIYGVDIQAIAIQISKLRFFISLIVDQKTGGTKENNYNVIPLPNLETKFVAANTLIGIKREHGVFSDPEIEKKQQDLLILRHRHFSARKADEKTLLRNQDKVLSKELAALLKKDGFYNAKDAAQMAEWNPYDQTKPSDFFDAYWMFGVDGGFDVVIGNPPYFVYKNERIVALKEIKLQSYYPFTGSGKLNAYRAFIAKSLKEITRTNGIFCMIFQNSFLGDSFVGGLRKYIFDNHSILSIDSFPERDNVSRRVFAGVKMSVCILTCKAGKTNDGFHLNLYSDKRFNKEYTNEIKIADIKLLDQKNLSIPLIRPEELSVLLKAYNISKIKVKAIEGEINMTFHKHLLSENNKNPEVLKGASIQRYRISEKLSQGKHEYLNVPQYEKENKGIKTTHHNFERLAMQGITGVDDKRRLIFAMVRKNYYLANSCNYILADSGEEAKYLLGILNSTLMNWIFKKNSTNSNVNCYEIANLPITSLPIQREKITFAVNKILAAKAADPQADTTGLEREIDTIVYRLYSLTYEEVKVIEPEFPLSRVEYEGIGGS